MRFSIVFGFFSVLVLAGCSLSGDTERADVTCPEPFVVKQLAEKSIYQGKETSQNLVQVVKFGRLSGYCVAENDQLDIEIQVSLVAQSGPAYDLNNPQPVSYVLALTTRDEEILGKKHFMITPKFSKTGEVISLSDVVEISAPLHSDQDGSDYQIMVGFDR